MRLTETETMRRLRERNVTDETIGYAFGLSRQRVHQKLGPKHLKDDTPPPEPPTTAEPPLEPPADLAAFLRSYRTTRNLSQATLARIIGTSQSAVAQWETGAPCRHAKLIAYYLSNHTPSK
jgi:ribosome-binding protein aMBF1 (putative translation factor)